MFDYLQRQARPDDTVAFLRQTRLHPLASLTANFGQPWLRPINDFSIPPDRVYERIAAWQLLDDAAELIGYQFEQQVVLIAPGGYDEAGVTPGADNFPVPRAVDYWRERLGYAASRSDNFAGSEALAYMIHHLLTQRLVIPIPTLWLIGVAALLGKGAALVRRKKDRGRPRWTIGLASATALYGLVGLQFYISAGILLPWLLPSTTFWIYVLPTLRKKTDV